MRALLLIPAFFVFSACIKAYIPFVGEPKYEEIIKQGKALYPDLFISPRETERDTPLNARFLETRSAGSRCRASRRRSEGLR